MGGRSTIVDEVDIIGGGRQLHCSVRIGALMLGRKPQARRKVLATYCLVYTSGRLRVDYQRSHSAAEPYAQIESIVGPTLAWTAWPASNISITSLN